MNKQLWILVAALSLIATFASAQTVEYIHTDALGSPVAVTNASGAVIERTVYEPYGAVVNRPLTNGPGYAGHVADAVTGLTYMQQRYYDPRLGRFLSNDPVTAASAGGNFNRYWYANNNPYRFIDPDGRQPCTGSIISRKDGTCSGTSRLTIIGGTPDDGESESKEGERPTLQEFSDRTQENIAELEELLAMGDGTTPYTPEYTTMDGVNDLLTAASIIPLLRIVRILGPVRVGARATTDIVATRNGLVNVRATLDRISAGGKLPHRNDGAIFQNREGLLPKKGQDYYREFVHPTPGVNGPGAQRIIQGQNGELYYTPDHYRTFIPLN